VLTWSRQNESRYLDHADGERTSIILFDVLARVNYENAQMVRIYSAGASPKRSKRSAGLRC